jgi:hypothetical protein
VASWLLVSLFLGGLQPAAASTETLAGSWRISDEVESTNYAGFQGLRLEYRVELRQEGVWLFGEGEKVAEHGLALPASRRTPISVVGSVAGTSVTASLFEKGHRRESLGEFSWTVSEDRSRMVGTFRSDAAQSRGRSLAERVTDRRQ